MDHECLMRGADWSPGGFSTASVGSALCASQPGWVRTMMDRWLLRVWSPWSPCPDPVLFAPRRSSLFFSHSVMSDSLQPHGLQYTRIPCPSPSPGICSNSCPLSIQWCHPTISSSVIPFSSCPQSFPASRFFPRSPFFTSNGQSIEASALASILPKNIQD